MLNEECLGRGYRQGKGPTVRLTSGLRARHFSRALQMLVTSECNVVCAKVEDGSERDRDGMSLYRKRLNYSLNRDYIAEARSHQEAETTVITWPLPRNFFSFAKALLDVPCPVDSIIKPDTAI